MLGFPYAEQADDRLRASVTRGQPRLPCHRRRIFESKVNVGRDERRRVAPASSPGEHRESARKQLSVVDVKPICVATLELCEQPLFSSRELVTDELLSSRIKGTQSDIRRVHVDRDVWRRQVVEVLERYAVELRGPEDVHSTQEVLSHIR